jgi:outer membrane protein TolC
MISPANRVFRVLLVLSAAGALWGCKVGPDYEAPPAPAPEGWSEEMEEGLRAESASLGTWWTALGDPTLDALVAPAV